MSFFICHYVILSYKNHQFLSVTLLFCLQKTSVSLCHYVILSSKKTSVSFRPFVILSSKKHLSHFVIMSFCLQKKHLSLSVTLSFCLQKKHLSLFLIMSLCLHKNICLSFSLCHYVGRQRIQNLDKTVQKNRKEGVSIMTHPLLLCYYLEEEISSQRPFYFFLPFVMYFIATFISLAITFASRWRSSLSFPCK